MSDIRLLVPVSDSPTVRQTVEYAVSMALAESDAPTLRFVYIHSAQRSDQTGDSGDGSEAASLLNRVDIWAREDAGEATITVETAQLGASAYLFSPDDVAAVIAADARDHDIDRVVLDPEYDPGIGSPLLRPLEYELTRFDDFATEQAHVRAQTRRTPLLERSSLRQVGALAGMSLAFYLVLAGTVDAFELVTGVAAALVVGIGLSQVTFSTDPSRRSVLRLMRMAVFVPYLLFEILKANVQIAMVILHPRLPIDPQMTRVEPALWGGLPITTIANSITLTPGTLTVRIEDRTLTVHTLVPASREDLFDGGLERAVRFVFYGRAAMHIGSLRDRGAAEMLFSGIDGSTTTATETDTADSSQSGDGEGDGGGDG